MKFNFPYSGKSDDQIFLNREWLVVNGLGGYASGTLLGVPTRRFHGLLIANLPAPWGRTMMLPRLDEKIMINNEEFDLAAYQIQEAGSVAPRAYLKEFVLDVQIPTWQFQVGPALLEKRLIMPHLQNTVCVQYTLRKGPAIEIHLRPFVTLRRHDGKLGVHHTHRTMRVSKDQYEAHLEETGPFLKFRLSPPCGYFSTLESERNGLLYVVEQERGYDFTDSLWSPGYLNFSMQEQESVSFIASTESWEGFNFDAQEIFKAENERYDKLIGATGDWAQSDDTIRQLVLAADQFIILPGSRLEERILARASGEDLRTVVAGYHWFTDWGRDTMISLEGLTLTTGRHSEAKAILHTFSHYIKDGLIPNHFPEGQNQAIYNTADATFWYFHAIDRYYQATQDRETLQTLFPALRSIIEHHIRGTLYGIGMDIQDGLIRAGANGFALTWMDAKCGDWVVTPRRGKPVEIQALWYNALRLAEEWAQILNEPSEEFRNLAIKVSESFNAKFWMEEKKYLFDVIDGPNGNDASLRPNQIFSISLRFPVLNERRWRAVFQTVTNELLTPYGLRSLAPGNPGYQPYYRGDLSTRDGAYHQGSIWGWLIGPYCDAYMKLNPEGETRPLLEGLIAHLKEAGVGSISEIFDAEAPFTPRACIAQAWSVAELLRILRKSSATKRLAT